jgi:hypothetical protein
MIYLTIALSISALTTLISLHKPIFRLIAEKKAIPKIEYILFPEEKKEDKRHVIDSINEITNKRLNDELILDYFYKIKGLQVLNNSYCNNYWVKVYLTSPTKVKLNYFEQVKFYEIFLNYPKAEGSYKDSQTNKVLTQLDKVKTKIAQNLISKRLV